MTTFKDLSGDWIVPSVILSFLAYAHAETSKPQNVPYGRHNDYILKHISVEILVKVVWWNLTAQERDLSHMV